MYHTCLRGVASRIVVMVLLLLLLLLMVILLLMVLLLLIRWRGSSVGGVHIVASVRGLVITYMAI